jgi:hypothetical protein
MDLELEIRKNVDLSPDSLYKWYYCVSNGSYWCFYN